MIIKTAKIANNKNRLGSLVSIPGYFKTECNNFLPPVNDFRKIIGKLLYISTNTRPDISAAVCILAKRVENPRSLNLHEAQRIMKYLISTKSYKLKLNNPSKEKELIAYSDANFAECPMDAKSNSGFI